MLNASARRARIAFALLYVLLPEILTAQTGAEQTARHSDQPTANRSESEQAAFLAHRAALREAAASHQPGQSLQGRVPRALPLRPSTQMIGATTVFTVNIDYDDPDNNPGDGVCYDGFGNGTFDECTMRAAIEEANSVPGTDPVVIRIDMMSVARGAQVTASHNDIEDLWTLFVNTPASVDTNSVLPPITRDNVLIDATTQLDGSGDGTFPDAYCGTLVGGDTSVVKVALDGSLLGGSTAAGLEILADNVEIRGLAIKNFPGHGITATAADSLKIDCTYVGTDHYGRASAGNGASGVAESGGSNFRFTHGIASANLVAGIHSSSPRAIVDSSFVGVDVTGTDALGNGMSGVYVGGVEGLVSGVISSDNAVGLTLAGDSAVVTNSSFGIGLNPPTSLPNGTGILVEGNVNSIGGVAGERVVASGNTSFGIDLEPGTTGNLVAGAIVGTNPSGTTAIPNGVGIRDRGTGNEIGEEMPPPPSAHTNLSSATAAIPEADGWSNLISGNTGDGVQLTGTSTLVAAFIGTNSAGSAGIPNGGNGVNITGGSATLIGGTAAGAGNLISANGLSGVALAGAATGVSIAGNYIGTDVSGTADLGNIGSGIRANSSGSVTIGGSAAASNLVFFNGAAGVRIDGAGPVTVQENAISANDGLGIDLSGDGVTPNDGGSPPDTDAGPNGLQNFPVIDAAEVINPTTVAVSFDFESTPSTEFRFDYYRNASPDPSGNGEGAVWLSSTLASTTAGGILGLGIGFDVADLPVGSFVTVTATSPSGQTSEFSNAVVVTGSVIELTDSRLLLEGPYAGGSMSTLLLTNGHIPLAQPHGDPIFNGSLQEFDDVVSVVSIPAGTVDWLTISLRKGVQSGTEAFRRVAFLQNNGLITDLDGSNTLQFVDADTTAYYLVVCHRNHLCAMSAAPIDFSGGPASYDFSTALTQAYTTGGAPMKNLGGGSFGLFAADSNVDDIVTAPDFNLWNAATTAGQVGYRAPDHNLDGIVTAPDFNLWNANTTAGAASRVPN